MQLEINGHRFVMQRKATALFAAERELNMGMLAFARKLQEGNVPLEHMALLIFHLLYAADSERAPSLDAIASELLAQGMIPAIDMVADIVSWLLEGEEGAA